jgi:hypothetical protein
VGVARVDLYLDGVLYASDSASPYSFSWNTTTAANGSHTLMAKAYDAAGNEGMSGTVSVSVSNAPPADTTPPTVAIASLSQGATVSGTITVSASASDNVGVARVDLYLDGVRYASDTTSPYSFSWNTTTAANGSHTLMAKAYDAAGNEGISGTVSVSVSNAPPGDTTPPTVTINSVTVKPNAVTVSISARDNVAVTRVELYIDGVLKARSSSSKPIFNPTFSVTTKYLPRGVHTVTATARDGAGNVGTTGNGVNFTK